jgi:hypothetical protein
MQKVLSHFINDCYIDENKVVWFLKYCKICNKNFKLKLFDEELPKDMCKQCERDSNLNKIFNAC